MNVFLSVPKKLYEIIKKEAYILNMNVISNSAYGTIRITPFAHTLFNPNKLYEKITSRIHNSVLNGELENYIFGVWTTLMFFHADRFNGYYIQFCNITIGEQKNDLANTLLIEGRTF